MRMNELSELTERRVMEYGIEDDGDLSHLSFSLCQLLGFGFGAVHSKDEGRLQVAGRKRHVTALLVSEVCLFAQSCAFLASGFWGRSYGQSTRTRKLRRFVGHVFQWPGKPKRAQVRGSLGGQIGQRHCCAHDWHRGEPQCAPPVPAGEFLGASSA
jgi:hypothetical protein